MDQLRYMATTLALAWLVCATGCAQWSARISRTPILGKCHDTDVQIPLVALGGSVQQPQSIEIGANKLTLRRALLTAGGARDIAVTGATTTFDPEFENRIKTLLALQRDRGKYNFYDEVWTSLDYPEDKKILPVLSTAVTDFLKINEEQIKEVRDKLLVGEELILELEVQAELIGRYQEILNLFDVLPGYFGPGETKDVIRKNIAAAEVEEAKVLSQLGGRAKTTGRTVRSEFLVALNRPTASPPVTYYFPYDLAIASQAGEIALQDGDLVDVVDVRDTELNPQFAESDSAANNVAVDGYLDFSGILENIATIGHVHSGTVKQIADARSCWMLVRPGNGGIGEKVFVLPDRMVNADGSATDAPTQDGDVYLYVILPQVPIVFESMLTRRLDAGGRLIDKIHEKKAERKETHALRHEYRAGIREQARERGQAQARAKFANGQTGVLKNLRARLP